MTVEVLHVIRMSIEVEHKFAITANTHTLLQVMGAVKEGSCTFSDTYYDVKDNQLMLRNYWLRQRVKQWQLKYPSPDPNSIAENRDSSSHTYTDKFIELDNHDEIMKQLSTVLSDFEDTEHATQTLDNLVSCGKLVPVVDYSTTRVTWFLRGVEGYTNVCVDLDQSCFGYSVGEVEIMVDSVEHVPDAEEKVKEIAYKLGMCSKTVSYFFG